MLSVAFIHDNYSFFFICKEPGKSPVGVRGEARSSTEILVQWGEVPEAFRHGKITRYTVYWETEGGEEKSKTVFPPKQDIKLTQLTKFTNYSIKVSASTIKGEGPASNPKVDRKSVV